MTNFKHQLNYKKVLFWIILIILMAGGGVFLILRSSGEKSLELIWPQGKEELRAGQTYQIKWKSRNIGKVGIMLIKNKEPKEAEWLLKDFPAGKKKYNWQIFIWQEPRQDYKIALFEYPWREGNKIEYSKNFTILGPQFASCDKLSVESEWPYLPSDFPNLKKVFITEEYFNGNLEGLEGADQKCQLEAENQKFEGKWKAFLGDDTHLAVERLNLDGIFVDAKVSGLLVEGKTCHRLLGKNFEEFFKKLSEPLVVNSGKFSSEFLDGLSNLWLGRINKESKRDCLTVFTKSPSTDFSFDYSFTTTCQNWTTNQDRVADYSQAEESKKNEFPICYTAKGERINAVALLGLSSGIIQRDGTDFFNTSLGKTCNFKQKLLCIQQ